MARKKDSKALFEVLSRTETTMSVPEWMKTKPADNTASPEAQTPASAEEDAASPSAPAETTPEAVEEPQEPPVDEIDAEVETEESDETETIEYEEPETDDEDVEDEVEDDVGEDDEIDEVEDAESTDDVDKASPAEPPPASNRRFAVMPPPMPMSSARFSMNPRKIVILIVVAGVLILLAILLGSLATSNHTETVQPQDGSTPTDNAPLRSVVDTDAPVTCVSGRRDPDRYFLIIETLRGIGDADKTEADRIIRFCRARGIPADMVELQRGNQPSVAVWCLLGYRLPTSKQAMEHAQNVENIGQEYYRKYRTHKFRQRRTRDGTLKPLFYPGKLEQPVE